MKPPEAGTPIPLVPPTQATEERAQAKEIGEHASRPREGHLGKKEAYKDTTISQVSKTKKGVGL